MNDTDNGLLPDYWLLTPPDDNDNIDGYQFYRLYLAGSARILMRLRSG